MLFCYAKDQLMNQLNQFYFNFKVIQWGEHL